MNDELYVSKQNRDNRARELVAEGRQIKCRRVVGQTMHPQYVKDWPYEYQTGFGNTDYLTQMPTLYQVVYQ